MSNNVYSPDKKYTWGPEDQFTLTGNEFGLILNSLRAVLGTPEASRVMLAHQANNIIENMVQRAVEEGVAVEIQEENNG
jgi:phage baseplate assembly protein W